MSLRDRTFDLLQNSVDNYVDSSGMESDSMNEYLSENFASGLSGDDGDKEAHFSDSEATETEQVEQTIELHIQR